jgi:gamma-glutamylcyclotransferase (GGCT)/AIG2-like uncharacterized protein YtfP
MAEPPWTEAALAAAQHRLAVYGTLAPGRENHWMLASLEGHWSDGFVRGNRLEAGWGYDFGFPGLRLDPSGEDVAVQVFESPGLATQWEKLDAFEGAEYERVVVEVVCNDTRLLAHVYVIRS